MARHPRSEVASGRPVWAVCVLAWAVPGAGHLWLGRTQKGAVLVTLLPLMYAIGLGLGGQIFTFDLSQPLEALAALADWGIGVSCALALGLGWGEGQVVARTYEYGNTFLAAAGLLNVLVVLDAYDIACGRKS